MADVDTMSEADVRAELKKMRDDKAAEDSKKPRRFIVQERKVHKKLDGGDKVKYSEWRNLAEAAIDGKDDEDKLEIILASLEGKALREIRRHTQADRDSATKILKILDQKYADRRTAAQIRKQYYDIAQGHSSINEFSDSLTECLEGTEEKLKGTDLDQMLRDQFTANVSDGMLRWELRKKLEENPGMKFDELRNLALDWECGMAKKSTSSSKKANVDEQGSVLKEKPSEISQLTQSINELRTEFGKIGARVQAIEEKGKGGNGGGWGYGRYNNNGYNRGYGRGGGRGGFYRGRGQQGNPREELPSANLEDERAPPGVPLRPEASEFQSQPKQGNR